MTMAIMRKTRLILYGILVLHICLLYVYRDTLLFRNSGKVSTNVIHKQPSLSQTESRRNSDRPINIVHHNEQLMVIAKECPDLNLTLPGLRTDDGTWYPIDEAKHAYVFSAYHDEAKSNIIQIIGARERNRRDTYFCLLWFPGAVKQGRGVAIDLHASGRRYTSCLFTCSIPNGQVPIAVSLTTENCSSPLNVLPVKEVRKRPYKRSFTVCLSPLNYRYGRAYELVEWMELNIILGAEKFVIYNYSSASNIVDVLNEYSKRGLAEVVQWRLPMGVDTWPKTKDPVEIHYFGQVSALNDCLLRSKETSEFVVNIDLDEFIIPHMNSTRSWKDMLSGLKHSGAYLFQHTYFRKEWDDIYNTFTRKDQADTYRLVTLQKTMRESQIHPHKIRSKYIARSNSVEVLVIHDITKMVSGQRPFPVPFTDGMVHHYRNYQNYNDKRKQVKDTTVIDKYKDDLIDNVAKMWSQLNQVKMDIPI